MKNVLHQYGVLFGSLLLAALFCAFVLTILPGCTVSSSDGIRSLRIGETVEINEGQTVRLGGHGPFLRFNEVHEGRCPSDVVCFWAGIAKAEFSLISAGGDSVFSLTIPGTVRTPYEENRVVDFAGFAFTLLDLGPYPDTRREEAPPQYRALIRVESADADFE